MNESSVIYGYDTHAEGDYEGIPLCWVAEFINGYSTKPEEISNEGIPVIRIEHLNDPDKRDDLIDPDGVPDKNHLRNGDLILSWSGSIGTWWWADGEAVLNQHLFRVIPHEDIDKRYLYYALKWVTPFLEAQMHGSAMTHITRDALRMTRIPLPPYSIQKRCARYLDHHYSNINSLIDKKNILQSILSEKKDAIITDVLTGGLREHISYKVSDIETIDKVPQHWEVVLNRGLFEEVDERLGEGAAELLSVSHKTGVTPRSEKEDVHMFHAESHEDYKIVKKGDLVINTMWAWMGAAGVAQQSGIVSPSYHVYRPRDMIKPEFADYLYRSPPYKAEMDRYSRGVWKSRKRLYPIQFLSMKTAIPPKNEQIKIVSYIKDQESNINKLYGKLERSIDLLEEKKRALLDSIITGQMDLDTWDPPEDQKEIPV